MKKAILVFIVLSFLPAIAATTTGNMTADETWSDTVTVTGDVVVEGALLTITPGTVVRFTETNDNVVEGNSGQIFFVVKGTGGMQAIGTPEEPITFTSAADNPEPGSWGQLHFIALKNDPQTILKYCILEWDRAGVGMRNDDSLPDVSAPIIDHCVFKHFTNSGVYGTSGCAATVTNCVFYDISSAGIFLHGANTVRVSNCFFYDLSTGVINANIDGGDYTEQHLILDHITIYNVDMMKSLNPKWWTGYAIYNANYPACSLTVTNSIISGATLAGLKINGWDVKEKHNCWFPGPMGLMTIEDGEVDSSSLEADPQMIYPEGNDFRLAPGSPCIGAADDGTNMGAWQDTSEWPPFGLKVGLEDIFKPRPGKVAFRCFPNPFTTELTITIPDLPDEFTIRIYNLGGNLLYTFTNTAGASRITWSARNTKGRQVEPGLYLLELTGPNISCRYSIFKK